MAITYPRTLPSTRMLSLTFEHEPQESFNPEQSGRFTSVSLGPALWMATFGVPCGGPDGEIQFSTWRAWLDSLDGAGKRFFAYDMMRPLPWKYRRTGFAGLLRASSGGAFDGTSAAWSVTDGDSIEIGDDTGEELPAGFELMVGDYIGFEWTIEGEHFRSLHRVMEGAAANGSGVGTWIVRPHVDSGVPDTATIQLVKPACIMVVTKRDRTREGKDRRISFEAQQVLEFEPAE